MSKSEQALLKKYAIWQGILEKERINNKHQFYAADRTRVDKDIIMCSSCNEPGCSGCSNPGCSNCSA